MEKAKINKILVGKRIKKIRLEKGMTLEKFGNLFNTSKSNVSFWESGKYLPNPERLKQIAKIGDMTVDELLKDDSSLKEVFSYAIDYWMHKIDISMLEEDEKKYLNKIKKIKEYYYELTGIDYDE